MDEFFILLKKAFPFGKDVYSPHDDIKFHEAIEFYHNEKLLIDDEILKKGFRDLGIKGKDLRKRFQEFEIILRYLNLKHNHRK